jgi:TonB family protein
MSEVWAKWEGQVVNGTFPLRRVLAATDYSGVFLTEFSAQNPPTAALKLVPAIPTLAAVQLAQWTAAAALSHPNLIRLIEMGRCRLGSLDFLFVVMDYAEQTLSKILIQRALTADEVREMLLSVLRALDFLHGRHLVQGRLMPANILAVGDQLKLASDTIRPAGESTAYLARPSVYDPPEASDGGFFPAGDMWSLGVTLIEALTQHPATSLPAAFPTEFAAIVRQCLNPNPAERPTAAALRAQLEPAPAAPVVLPPQPATPVKQSPAPSPEASTRQGASTIALPKESSALRWSVAALGVAFVVILAVWASLHSHHRTQNPQTPDSEPAAAAQPAASPAPAPADQSARPPASDGVLHQEIPEVPHSALATIHGRIQIAVHVTVDASGNVTHVALENSGGSYYFARLATAAAGKWKFVPADPADSRKWLLKFDFTRGGVTAHASAPRA